MFENGSEILRLDCHLHTKQDKEFKYDGEKEVFASEYVTALAEKNVSIGIITNHNKFVLEEYKTIKKVANRKDIFILPGVELSMKEGAKAVHALIVFNPDEWIVNGIDYISRTIDALFLGVDDPGNENVHCGKDVMTCIRKLNELNKDYFIIFAHVEQEKGFWQECGGSIIKALAQEPEFRERVLGFQKVRTRDKIRVVHDWMQYDIAFVEGSDPKKIEDIGKGTHETYIKVGEYSYGAIKYALKDYKNRLYCNKPTITHGYIKSVTCVGGKLNGQVFSPSPELNTLIGIRGSGKSSILEVIRYGLDIEPAKPDFEYKRDLVKSVLGSGGQVEINIVDKYKREYTIKRILNESPTIIDETGRILNVPVCTVLNNPLYFGQKDLALTRAGYEMDLLNKIVGEGIEDVSSELKKIVEQLSVSIKNYKEVSDIPLRIAEISAKNSEIKHKLQIYIDKGVDEKLRKQTACNNDLVKLNSVYNRVREFLNLMEGTYLTCNVDDLRLEDYVSEYNKEIFDEANMITKATIGHLGNIKTQIEALKQLLTELSLTKSRLEVKIDSLKEEFAQIKREIKDDTIDIDSYVSYQKQITTNDDEIRRLNVILKDKEVLKENIKALLDKRTHILRKSFQAYEKCIAEINEKQNELHMSIEFKGNREKFKTDLKNIFKGTGLSEIKYNELVNEFSDFSSIIEDYFLQDGKNLKKICSENAYLKVVDKIQDFYEEILKFTAPDSIKITYHGKVLSKHSLGQRASALILFILTQNDSDVIIIDQPEDDLDNQVIYKELINTIRDKKKEMQFIFATHNANIPVLGDAERVVTTEYDVENEKISLKQGTIDTEETHKCIVDIMEGGEEAFRKRNEIYTSW